MSKVNNTPVTELRPLTGAHRRALEKGHNDDKLLDTLDALLVISDLFDSEHMAELFAIYFGNKIFHNMTGMKALAEELKREQRESRVEQLQKLITS